MPGIPERLKTALAEHYDLERELGAGGMATVYLARDRKHDRRVAVKVLKPELAAALGTERFPREIKIVAQLHHPHILPLHDSGEAVRITDDPDVEGLATWTADGTALTFHRSPSTAHLWTVGVDGGAPRQLTSGQAQDFAPQVSPDGTRVLFVSDRGGSQNLWVVPLAGGEPRRLTDSPQDDGPGFWSPDGQTIVFVGCRDPVHRIRVRSRCRRMAGRCSIRCSTRGSGTCTRCPRRAARRAA